jgi:hypothetical protein
MGSCLPLKQAVRVRPPFGVFTLAFKASHMGSNPIHIITFLFCSLPFYCSFNYSFGLQTLFLGNKPVWPLSNEEGGGHLRGCLAPISMCPIEYPLAIATKVACLYNTSLGSEQLVRLAILHSLSLHILSGFPHHTEHLGTIASRAAYQRLTSHI